MQGIPAVQNQPFRCLVNVDFDVFNHYDIMNVVPLQATKQLKLAVYQNVVEEEKCVRHISRPVHLGQLPLANQPVH